MSTKRFSFLILVSLFILSKEILVFNEEILVFLSFVLFFFLSSDFVANLFLFELNLRSVKIKEDFNFLIFAQEKTFMHLISYYNKYKLLCEKIKLIFLTVDQLITSFLYITRVVYLKLLISGIEEKLKKIYLYELKAVSSLQYEIIVECYLDFFYRSVMSEYIKSKRKPLPISPLLKRAFSLLTL